MKGHLEPRGKNRWRIVLETGLDEQGRRRRRVVTFIGGKREAEQELTRLLRLLDTGLLADSGRLRVGDYLEKWLEHTARSVAPRTAERYAGIVRLHLKPALGHHRLESLRPMHIAAYETEALRSGRLDGKGALSPQTVVHHHRVLHEALRQAVRWQLLSSNPAAAVDPPKVERHGKRALDEEQTRALIEATRGTDLYVPVLLAVTTGMRLGEILGLRWQDVDLERGRLSVTRSLQATKTQGLLFCQPKTMRSCRSIPLMAMTIDALREHRKAQVERRLAAPSTYNDHGLAFPAESGAPWHPATFSSSWSRMRDGLGLDIRFHDLRHTHATLLLRQGVHVKVVSERLGHSTVGITLDTYSHVLPDMQLEATQKLEAVLNPAASSTTQMAWK